MIFIKNFEFAVFFFFNSFSKNFELKSFISFSRKNNFKTYFDK